MNDQTCMPMPAWFKPEDHLAQYLDGKETDEIAKKLGVSKDRLVYYLASRTPEQWMQIQLARSLKRYEAAEKDLDDARDTVAINKAVSKIKSAQWILERVCRRVYGEVKKEEPQVPVVVNINLGRHKQQTEIEINPRSVSENKGMTP